MLFKVAWKEGVWSDCYVREKRSVGGADGVFSRTE